MQPRETTFRTRIKVCGITRPSDAEVSADLGADAIGLNFYPKSKRYVSQARAKEIVAQIPVTVEAVAVVVDASDEEIRSIHEETGIGTFQFHGSETPQSFAKFPYLRAIKAFSWKDPSTADEIDHFVSSAQNHGKRLAGIVVDSFIVGERGGTGKTWNWNELASWRPTIHWLLAGGLRPENVSDAVLRLRPFGVDVAGGIESDPGVKDTELTRKFISAIRQADQQILDKVNRQN